MQARIESGATRTVQGLEPFEFMNIGSGTGYPKIK